MASTSMRWVRGLGAAIVLVVAGCGQVKSTASQVVFDGQSLNNLPEAGPTYPQQTMAGRDERWSSAAWNGTSWTKLAVSTQHRLYPRVTQGTDTLVMNGGFSDIRTEGNTGAQLYADEVAYAAAARAAGFEWVIITTLPPSVQFDATMEAERQAHNALLIQDPESAFDAVVDIASIPGIDDPRDRQYYTDGTHWTAEAAGLAAAAVREEL